MVVRVHPAASIAALAVAAWPFSAHAQESPTPNIGCTAPAADALTAVAPSTVSGINWGDGFSLGAPSVLVDTLPAVQFNCSNNMYSTPTRQGSMFEVNFGALGSVAGETLAKIEIVTNDYKEFKFDTEYKVTEFDIYLDFSSGYYKITGGIPIIDHQDFIGIKAESPFGDSQLSNPADPFFVDSNGNLILDPTIPSAPDGSAGTVTVDLITTPTPEPATFALFGTGLLAAARVLRRKSRR